MSEVECLLSIRKPSSNPTLTPQEKQSRRVISNGDDPSSFERRAQWDNQVL